MTNLLDWATTGTGVLVGVTDPADATTGMLVVRGSVEQDSQGRTVFPEGSEAHLRWLIRAAQQGIRHLLGDRTVSTPTTSRRLTELAGTLHSLMLRADLMAEPARDGALPAA